MRLTCKWLHCTRHHYVCFDCLSVIWDTLLIDCEIALNYIFNAIVCRCVGTRLNCISVLTSLLIDVWLWVGHKNYRTFSVVMTLNIPIVFSFPIRMSHNIVSNISLSSANTTKVQKIVSRSPYSDWYSIYFNVIYSTIFQLNLAILHNWIERHIQYEQPFQRYITAVDGINSCSEF